MSFLGKNKVRLGRRDAPSPQLSIHPPQVGGECGVLLWTALLPHFVAHHQYLSGQALKTTLDKIFKNYCFLRSKDLGKIRYSKGYAATWMLINSAIANRQLPKSCPVRLGATNLPNLGVLEQREIH